MYKLLIKLLAFIKRDFILNYRYPLSFLLSLLGLFIATLNIYFISRLMGPNKISSLAQYGGDYFSFVLVGMSFFIFLEPALGGLSRAISFEQMAGTLESVLVKPISIYAIFFSMPLYGFIFAFFRCLIVMTIGVLFLGVNLVNINIFLLFLILIFSIISLLSIGVISASFIIVFKRGDPINFILGNFAWFFGGMFFPTQIFPKPLQFISNIVPVTYSLRALRYLLLTKNPPSIILPDIITLAGFCLVLLPIGLMSFRYALKKVERDGGLAKY